MRRPPPPHPRGTPRTPGSGRRPGSQNRKTIELKALLTLLVNDVDYQHRLRADFRRRRIHPTIEALVWGHVVGRPTDQVRLTADVTMNQKLDRERELFLQLDVPQLEALAAESQALVDKAMALVKANAGTGAASAREDCVSSDASGPRYSGTDVARSGNGAHLAADARARSTLVLVNASPSPAAAVENVATAEPVDPSTSPSVAAERDAAGADITPRCDEKASSREGAH